MALLTPASLTQIWNVNPGLTHWYRGGWGTIQVATDGLFVAGVPTGNSAGCNLIRFDPSTGEPLAFDEHELVATSATRASLGLYHFPGESAVVLVATVNAGTSGTPRTIYAQRVEYDVAACTLTGGAVATWDVNTGTNDLTRFAADVPDSSTVNILGMGAFSLGGTTLDLAAGTNSGRTNWTIAAVGISGGRDRLAPLGTAGVAGPGVAVTDAYVNASGSGSAVAYLVTFNGGTPVATSLGLNNQTAGGTNLAPLTSTSSYNRRLTFTSGTFDYELTTSGLTALPDPDVFFDATVWAYDPQATYAGKFVTFNNEGASSSAFNPMRSRTYDPTTGTEHAAWEFPYNHSNYSPPFLGMFTSNERFWWADFGSTSFRVFENLAWVPDTRRKWWLGVAGWSGN